MRQPYVSKKVSRRTGQTRYTAMYFDDKGIRRSAGTYDDEAEALSVARGQQGKKTGDSLGGMTLAQKRAVTFDQFWPLFQRHHRVEPNSMQNYFSIWINHVRPYLRDAHIATFSSTDAIVYFTVLADDGVTVSMRKKARTLLSAMIRLAILMEYRTVNPVKGLEVGKEPASKSIKVINEAVFWGLCDRLRLGAIGGQ
jgi:hypothetical protein